MKLAELGSKGFIIDNKNRKDYTKSKKMYLRKSAVDALIKAKSFLPEKHNFKIWDGKRSVAEQRRIIKICEEDFKKKYPKNWHNMLVRYTGGYEVLKQKSFWPASHLGGGAVDLTIVKGKRELDMGGIKLNEQDALNYYEKKKRLSKKEKEIRENRRLLKRVMRKAGFKGYKHEWWHWGYKE